MTKEGSKPSLFTTSICESLYSNPDATEEDAEKLAESFHGWLDRFKDQLWRPRKKCRQFDGVTKRDFLDACGKRWCPWCHARRTMRVVGRFRAGLRDLGELSAKVRRGMIVKLRMEVVVGDAEVKAKLNSFVAQSVKLLRDQSGVIGGVRASFLEPKRDSESVSVRLMMMLIVSRRSADKFVERAGDKGWVAAQEPFTVDRFFFLLGAMMPYPRGLLELSDPGRADRFIDALANLRAVESIGCFRKVSAKEPRKRRLLKRFQKLFKLLNLEGKQMGALTYEVVVHLVDSYLPSETAEVKNIAMACFLRDFGGMPVSFEDFNKASNEFLTATLFQPKTWRMFLSAVIFEALAGNKTTPKILSDYLAKFAVDIKAARAQQAPC